MLTGLYYKANACFFSKYISDSFYGKGIYIGVVYQPLLGDMMLKNGVFLPNHISEKQAKTSKNKQNATRNTFNP